MEEGEEQAQSEDERKKYNLKCLNAMKEKNSRYWSVVLNSLMPNQNLNNNTLPGHLGIP
jgi:hypothetical protein